MSKIKKRHNAIKSIITSQSIADQQELLDAMESQFGISSSQAIISRDLQTLGIAKRKVQNKMMYELPKVDPIVEVLRYAIVDITHNETTIVIHTIAGCADFVGDYLDTHANHDILGTIAGENTILVIPASIKKIKTTVKNVKTLLSIRE